MGLAEAWKKVRWAIGKQAADAWADSLVNELENEAVRLRRELEAALRENAALRQEQGK